MGRAGGGEGCVGQVASTSRCRIGVRYKTVSVWRWDRRVAGCSWALDEDAVSDE